MTDRHAWLEQAAQQVRNWREEDRRNGIIWNDGQSQEARVLANNRPANLK